jgi:hypothetical protein
MHDMNWLHGIVSEVYSALLRLMIFHSQENCL